MAGQLDATSIHAAVPHPYIFAAQRSSISAVIVVDGTAFVRSIGSHLSAN